MSRSRRPRGDGAPGVLGRRRRRDRFGDDGISCRDDAEHRQPLDVDHVVDDAPRPTTSTTSAPTTTVAPVPYPDHVSALYAGTQNWICHPDLAADECRDLAATVIAPDGSATVEEVAPAVDPSFDCFYVYPTTSADVGPNSDLALRPVRDRHGPRPGGPVLVGVPGVRPGVPVDHAGRR